MMDIFRGSSLLKNRLAAIGLHLRFFGGSRYDAEPYMRKDYRRNNILPKPMNQCPQLMEGADYTFTDGRPTPYGSRQLARFQKQKEYTEKIVKLTREVDMAKSIHKRRQVEKSEEIDRILQSKFKAKGKITLDS